MKSILIAATAASTMMVSLSGSAHTASAFELRRLISEYTVAEGGTGTQLRPANSATNSRARRGVTVAPKQFGNRAGGGGTGWGCRTCGYSNGPYLSGLKREIGATAVTVVLRDGTVILLR